MERLTRRQIIQLLSLSAMAAGCSAAAGADEDGESSGSDIAASVEAATMSERHILGEIDHFVILMMENRSFDHYLGALQRDTSYANRRTIDGTAGDEWNPNPNGHHVKIHDANTFKLANPPHTWEAAHKQWNHGKNDHFVIAHAGAHENQVMAFYDRKQIPFYYHLADHFTVMDNWHASVMGPTSANRLFLNCGTSAGRRDNGDPLEGGEPETIWDQLRKKGVSAKSYYAGRAGLMAHTLKKKTAAGKIPFARIAELHRDVKNGTLPAVSYVEPDYQTNCDHPAHDIRLGQAFVQGIYKTLKASKAWAKTLFVVIYDEHGGFWDHVAPPPAKDVRPAFRRYGFRVPAFAAGGLVRRGYVGHALHDHTSVLATLALRFGLPDITERAGNANTLAHVLDPNLLRARTEAVAEPEPIVLDAEALETIGENGQEELEEAILNGEIPEEYVDGRPLDTRVGEWLLEAQDVGAVKLAP